ncbi:sugar phosphate isomerase/epimerase family protein [Wenxinia saemankumensis]|uniref:Sugar phosphate isomerase/epimerase n=1 Tax=Wenxinia saemankumensis TaxID=1447782 RepID=A0A1M6G928_9RHOB|nr:sugar phosphate isomerase/epimerase [Wenxinia saemankumensis]SHJ06486.1 Sugar phosphate isomerase/epimerase [Wenxinia saemankumensis]
MPTIAYQLYCSRNWPLEDTLKMLKAAGYSAVEGYGALFANPGELVDLLKANDMAMPSGHFGLDMVEGDPDQTIKLAKDCGVKKVFVPFLMPDQRPDDREGWEAFAKRLAEAGKPIRDAGLAYGWHNHDFELADLGGITPLDLIAEAGVDLELDLGWVKRGGQSPVAWIDKYASRISAVHVKDIAPEGEATDEGGWADVGHGTMDWGSIKPVLDAAGITHYVLEHDNPNDHERFATRSLATVKGWN